MRKLVTAGSVLALVLAASPVATAQVPGPYAAAPVPAAQSTEEMSALVAPVALYPDELLAVVLKASTEPVQVVQAVRFLDKHAKDKSLQPNAAWSEPVKVLLNYPEVLRKMSDDLDWTERLGEAMRTNPGDVLAGVQQFRRRVAAAGNLRSDDKLVVAQDGANYVIESVNPQVIYVPVYDPAVVVVPQPQPAQPVYVPEPYPAYWYPAAAAATGFFLGAMTTAWAMDWHGYHIDEDDLEDFQEYRQQSLTQRQQNRQAAAEQRQQQRQQTQGERQQQRQQSQAERQGQRQQNQAERQQRRQDVAQGRPGAAPQSGQDIRAALGGERPRQGAIGGGAAVRPDAGRPTQLPSGAGGFGGRQPDIGRGERPAQMPAGGGARIGGQQPGGFGGDRPGYAAQRGGSIGGSQRSMDGFSYGSGRSAHVSSNRGAYSRNPGGGGRQFSGGGGRGGGGRGGRR